MGFTEVIVFAIVIFVISFILLILTLLAYPLKHVGFASLEPKPVTKFTWNLLMKILLIICVVFFIAFLILYLIWSFIKHVIRPIFILIPFGEIIWQVVSSITPFRELTDCGIFDLFDGLFSGSKTRLRNGLQKFYIKGLSFTRGYARSKSPEANLDNVEAPGEKKAMQTVAEQGGIEEEEQMDQTVLTQSEQFQLKDKYLSCVRKKTIPMNRDDSFFKNKMTEYKNDFARSQCQADNMELYMKFTGDKYKRES